ncbi:MAG: hypothetical protein ABJA67_09395 [Chthonomonadales bacterium]
MRNRSGSRFVFRVLGISAIFLLICFVGGLTHGFDADELQNLHFAYNIQHGLMPFRDFFEHHPPVFHYVLAAITQPFQEPSFGLLLLTRSMAMVVLAYMLWAFYRLIRLALKPRDAAIGILALLSINPFGLTAMEFRADWLALGLLLHADRMLLLAMRSRDRLLTHGLPGALLFGGAICLTQKSIPMVVAALLWAGLATVFSRRTELRGARWTVLSACAALAPAPFLAAWGWFGLKNAGAEFIRNVVLIDLHWKSEGTWRYVAQQTVPLSAPLFIAAYAGLAAGCLKRFRLLTRMTFSSFVGAQLFAGTFCMFATPVPHGQSFAFYVVPWVALMATRAIAGSRFLRSIKRSENLSLPVMVGGAFTLAACYWYNAALTLMLWAVIPFVILAIGKIGNRMRLTTAQACIAAAAIGLGVQAGSSINSAMKGEGIEQASVQKFVTQTLDPEESIIGTWPLLTPYRRQPTYHGFARRGLVQTVGVSALEEEYISAMRSGKTRAALVDEKDVAIQMPGFARFLHEECIQAPGMPPNRDRAHLYLYEARHVTR